MENTKNGWEIVPFTSKNNGIFASWRLESKYQTTMLEEQKRLDALLRLFTIEEFDTNNVGGWYGYYCSEQHGLENPADLPANGWKKVYETPFPVSKRMGEYNIVKVNESDHYVYYAISLNGSADASAVTEYVRLAK